MERKSSSNMKERLPGLQQRSPAAHGEQQGKEACPATAHGGPQRAQMHLQALENPTLEQVDIKEESVSLREAHTRAGVLPGLVTP